VALIRWLPALRVAARRCSPGELPGAGMILFEAGPRLPDIFFAYLFVIFSLGGWRGAKIYGSFHVHDDWWSCRAENVRRLPLLVASEKKPA
jgi:hypothetical protein